MQDNRSLKGWPLRGTGGLILALSAVILMAGGGTAWWSWQRLTSLDESIPAEVEGTDSSASTTDTASGSAGEPVAIAPTIAAPVTVYLLDATEAGMKLVPITMDAQVDVDTADEPATILTAAFEQLLEGNVTEDGSMAFSEIPADTDLLALSVAKDGVYVDLSGAFEVGGGSASMIGRLTQVMYTATSLDAEQPVWLSVEGEPLELLGGEGLEIPQPMTRAEIDADFPLN